MDVAAAGRALARARPRAFEDAASRLSWSAEQLQALWLHLLALHDLGKFSPLFQAKAEHDPSGLAPMDATGRRQPDPGHPAAGFLLLAGWLDADGAGSLPALFRRWPPKRRNALLQPIFGHHGRPVRLPSDRQPDDWRPLFAPVEAANAALAYWEAIAQLVPAPDLAPPPGAAIAAASWALAGLTALADWIGSNQRWFPYVPHDTPLAAYWEQACRQADRAVGEAGLRPAPAGPRLGFGALTGLDRPPTAAQRWADTVELGGGPVLALVEDVTGGGKTEAALALAHRLISAGRADGLYLALPTMATANAMFDRIAPLASRLYRADARPSLALAHGRADLHPAFRPAMPHFPTAERPENPAGEDEDGAILAPAWLASESRKALLADLGIGTIDQAVLAVLPNRYGAVRLAGLARKVLIVDEAHSYDAYLGAELETLVAFHAGSGGSVVILSATLPARTKARLVEAWRRALGGPAATLAATAYPLGTLLAPSGPPVEAPLAARADLCRTVAVTRVPDADAAVARIREAAEAGACVAWIRNTVDDAIEGAAALREAGLAPDLFHARFAMGDRLATERRVLERFGKGSTAAGRRGRVIVGTQVLEMSLDYDVDLMVADLAPVDSLIQRAGRLWRHAGRERPIPGPELVVVSPDPSAPIAAEWARAAFPRASFVYRDHAILWRTAREMVRRPAFRVPENVRPAIEAVYADDEADIPEALMRAHNEALGRAGAERGVAGQNLLEFARGYEPDGKAWQAEDAVSTRLAEDARPVRLAKPEGGRLVPWHADPDLRLAWALSEVAVYERKLRGRHVPEARWQDAAAAARADWGRFADEVVLLPLEEGTDGLWRGVLLDPDGRRIEVGYSTASGLML